MPKKSIQPFCHCVRQIGLSSWFNISPFSFKNMYSPWRWASSWRSSRFCFSLGSACKRKYFLPRCGDLLLVVVVLLVDQVCDQFVQSMRNSDPQVRIVFAHRFNSDFHSMFALQVTGYDFQHGPKFLCCLEFILSGQLICRLVVTCTHHMPLILWIVSILQCVLSWSVVRLQLLSEILHQYKS